MKAINTMEVDVDFFERLLACLDNQKFVNTGPCNGDSLASPNYKKIQKEIQFTIDKTNRQARELLHKWIKKNQRRK